MQTQPQNEDAKNLAERVNADLTQPQHRYRLYDPASESTLHFPRAQLVTAKANELGVTSFEAVAANGQAATIQKSENQWKREDGKPLADVQADIDKESVNAIEARAVLRKAAGQGVDAATDKQLLAADLQAFKRIEHAAWQEDAAGSIAGNAQSYPGYKQALEKGIPAYLNAAVQIATLDAANTEKVNAKEEAKWIESQALLLEREARAKKWTQEDAQKQAQVDSNAFQEAVDKTERSFLLDEIAFNAKANLAYKASLETIAPSIAAQIASERQPVLTAQTLTAQKSLEVVFDTLALNRVAELRKRDSQEVREAFEANSIEASLKKEIKLEGEAEAKRSAWLKKSQAAPGTESRPEATANKIESDEIFAAGKAEVKLIVPSEIEKQFLRVGNKFYYPKNRDNKEVVAFEDKGNRLETKSNSESIADTLVRIAEARGWDEIKISGTESFRREVWMQASSKAIQVKGYTPTELDKFELEKRLGTSKSHKVEPENKPFRVRENETSQAAQNKADISAQSAAPITAKTEAQASNDKFSILVAHGAAKYLHDEKNKDSYFVTTRDSKGVEKTAWGVDLERAVKESAAKPGDKIALANEGQKQVTVNVPVHDASGKVVGSQEKDARRVSWNIEMTQTFAKESTADAVKKYPELAGAAAILTVVDKKAEADGLNKEQRAVVSARAREGIVNRIERGTMPSIKVKQVEVSRDRVPERDLER